MADIRGHFEWDWGSRTADQPDLGRNRKPTLIASESRIGVRSGGVMNGPHLMDLSLARPLGLENSRGRHSNEEFATRGQCADAEY